MAVTQTTVGVVPSAGAIRNQGTSTRACHGTTPVPRRSMVNGWSGGPSPPGQLVKDRVGGLTQSVGEGAAGSPKPLQPITRA